MSDGPSTRTHRITYTDFRPCSRCRARSQAGFCVYTRRAITDRTEPTIARLRYFLGGDRPSQTTRLTLSLSQIHGSRLEIQRTKGGISRLAPPQLAPWLQSLPPILYMVCRIPISGCSKGARGLSVLMRVTGVFTGISTSPSPSR